MARVYAPIPPPPKPGWYKSIYGGVEQTKLAGYPHGTGWGLDDTISINRDMSRDAVRARVRARKKNAKQIRAHEREIDELIMQLAAEEAEAKLTQEFHNGG